jgi:hypothetical protein
VLVFEDLHWADEGLLVSSMLADWSSGVLLRRRHCAAGLLDRRPGWGGEAELHDPCADALADAEAAEDHRRSHQQALRQPTHTSAPERAGGTAPRQFAPVGGTVR